MIKTKETVGKDVIIQGKENVVDSILCKGSNKCLSYNALRHTIQSATKNKI